MSIKDMPCVTVEQVVRLRNKAIQIESQRDRLREALEDCFDALLVSAIPAGGCDDGQHMIDAQRNARAALNETEEDSE